MRPQIWRRKILRADVERVWKLIRTPQHLEWVHPFCAQHQPLLWEDEQIKKDQLTYINGLVYEREFVEWLPLQGYSLWIGTKEGKKSKVIWELTPKGQCCELKISVFPYQSQKISKLLYPLVEWGYIKPQLESYLDSVLRGIDHYLNHQKAVPKNHFGKHRWFSRIQV